MRMPTPSGNARTDSPFWFCEPPTTFVTGQLPITPSLQSNTPPGGIGVPSVFCVGIDVYGVCKTITWWLPAVNETESLETHVSGTVTNWQYSASAPGGIVTVMLSSS